MKLFDLISIQDPLVTPEITKLHVATSNGTEHPMDEYLANNFQVWQGLQKLRNFERKYVLSLIDTRVPNRYLFAGVHLAGEPTALPNGGFFYSLEELQSCTEFNGRLIVEFVRPGRQPYLLADKYADKLLVHEIRPEKLSIGVFPGYRNVLLTMDELKLVVKTNAPGWQAALSSVAGIYLISDEESGKLYVGSAAGEGGIWQRWTSYADTGHGGNVELKKLLGDLSSGRHKSFKFSILEIADIHEGIEDIRNREIHWKNVLLSRIHGFNAN